MWFISIHKRSQVWYTDFIIGILIFSIAVTTFFYYATGAGEDDGSNLNDLIIDAKVIAENLVSEGYPTDWTPATVERIGLTNGNQRIDQSKLDDFTNMTYSERKSALGTPKNYYFYLEYPNSTKFNILGQEGNSSNRLVQITRLAVYESQPVRMVFYLWD
ncbi:hypothetical protein KY339_04885 [Candidatus Woesearchaeota archaeon]|nr:hypothetical protein [Candidatus Woesearchaeota archaeon]